MHALYAAYAAYALWIATQAALFAAQLVAVLKSKQLFGVRDVFGWTLPVAKAAAICVNLNSALLMVSKLRLLFGCLPQSLLIMTIEMLHKWFGVAVVGWSVLHTVAHLVNYGKAGNGRGLWTSGTTITGFLMLSLLSLISIGSLRRIRRTRFRWFTITHSLVVPYTVLLVLHGAFCLLKTDSGKCNPPTSWRWMIGPVALWVLESVLVQWRVVKGVTVLKRVIVHPSFVIELLFDKPALRFSPGQFVYLKMPLLSLFEWHPFTLTSSPHDELHTVHIRVTGEWTKRLAECLHVEYKPDGSAFCHPLSCLPEISIDGPYGHGWMTVLKRSLGDGVVVCIGAGIGQTPFASILKTWWHNYDSLSCKTIVFYAICRETLSHEWFHRIIADLEEKDDKQKFAFKIFVTGSLPADQIMNISLQRQATDYSTPTGNTNTSYDTVTGLLSPTQFGRPNFRREFGQLSGEHGRACTYSVFFCGPPRMAGSLEALCAEQRRSGHHYSFYSESFE